VEQYAHQTPEEDFPPDWLQKSWQTADETGLDQLTLEEIGAEISAARKARQFRPQP